MSPQYEYYFTRNVLTLVGSARATSRVATLVHMTPYLVRRVLEQGPRRHFARARTMVRYDLIGIADFWRSRSGRRADL